MWLPLLLVSSMNNSWDKFNWLMGLKAHHTYIASSPGSLLKIGGVGESPGTRLHHTGHLKWTIQLHVPGCLVSRCSQARGSVGFGPPDHIWASSFHIWRSITECLLVDISHWNFQFHTITMFVGLFFQGAKVGNLFIVWHSLTSNMEVKECHVIKWKFMRSLLKNVQCLGVTLFIVLNRSVHTDLHTYCLTSSNKT